MRAALHRIFLNKSSTSTAHIKWNLERKNYQRAMNQHSRYGERRKTFPPSDALLARVCAVIDLLIASGLSEDVATQAMVQRMMEAGVRLPENEDAGSLWKRIKSLRVAFQNGAATDDTFREYQNVVAAIELLPPEERVERVLGNELWDRRRLDLHSNAARRCKIY